MKSNEGLLFFMMRGIMAYTCAIRKQQEAEKHAQDRERGSAMGVSIRSQGSHKWIPNPSLEQNTKRQGKRIEDPHPR